MDDHTIIGEIKPEELKIAEKLTDESKYTEALIILKEFEKKDNVPLYYRVYNLLLQGRLLMFVGKHGECLKITEEAYNESLELGRNLISVEALNLRALVYNWQGQVDKSYRVIKKSEELFKTFSKESTADYIRTEAQLNMIKGFLISKKDADKGLELLNYSISLWDKLDLKIGKAMTMMCIGLTLYYCKGELNQSIKYFEQGLEIAENLNHKYGISFLLNHLGNSYLYKGEFNRSLYFYQKSLKLYEEISNKSFRADTYTQIGNILGQKGKHDEALKYIEKSIEIFRDIGELYKLLSPFGTAIELSLYKGDIDLANKYLDKLKQIKDHFKNTIIDLWVIFYEALLLKRSQRTRDMAKAEDLLLTLLERVEENFGLKIEVLIQLCDLYLTELQSTNNLEVLDDIKPIINRLLEIAKNSHSHLILCETYILKAKLALITLDVKEARKFLTQAQKIAKKYGLDQLALEISNEHDELLRQLRTWENLQKSDAPIAERIKSTRLGDQIESMLHKHVNESLKASNENPVVLLITSEAGTPIFSKAFKNEFSFKDHLWSGFLTAFNSFSDEMLSEGLERAKFGEYTLLMKAVSPFLVCYLFKGQSYLAQQKLESFIDKISNNDTVWQTFNKYYQTNQEIQIKDIPILENLLTESFLPKSAIQ